MKLDNKEIKSILKFECEHCQDKKEINLQDVLPGIYIDHDGDLVLECVCKKCEGYNIGIIIPSVIRRKSLIKKSLKNYLE